MLFSSIITDGLRDLWASLCQFLYSLIAWLYDLFMNLSSVKLLTQSDIKPIYQRVTIILTIIMVFYVTLEVVKYVLEPDNMTDKEKGAGKVVQRMIIVVVLIAFVPTIFEKAYDLQNSLIKNQVFSKIILGEENINAETYGRQFSASLFGMFYYFDADTLSSEPYELDIDKLECDDVQCQSIVELNLNHLETEGKMPLIHVGLNQWSEKVDVGLGDDEKQKVRLITFDGLLAVIIGIVVCYMLVLYCIDVGVRIAQMLFLQIIAPIPIIGYLAPKKDGIFQKWVKQCVTTYLDLFMRIIIIYFVMLIIGILSDAYHSGTLLNNFDDVSRTMKVFMYVFIVMGLMLFASKAPKMLEELLPGTNAASGKFGLKGGERVAPLAARTIGAGIGLARTGVRVGISRGRNVRKRNKDLKEKLREEGKPTDRKSMSEARKAARKDLRATRRNKNQSARALDRADKEYRDAERALNKAKKKGTSSEEIGRLERNLSEKKKIYEARSKGYDSTNINRTKANLNQASNELKDAINKRNAAVRDGSYAKMSKEEKDALNNSVNNASKKYNDAKKEHDEATKEYNLLNNNSKEAIKAKNDLDNLKEQRNKETDPAKQKELDEKIEKAQAKYDEENVKANSGYLANRREYETSRSNIATERNQTYGAYAGVQAAGAAIRGMATGAISGAKATKISDINKNVSQGIKNVQQSEATRMQYLEDGGSATFSGTVDRVVAREQQRLGIRTESERIKEEVRHLESQSNNLNAQASMESSFKGAQDEAESRSQGKIEKKEQKIKMKSSDRDSLQIKDSSGNKTQIRFNDNDTTSDVYMRYEQEANTAKANADAANEAYTKAMIEAGNNPEKRANAEKMKDEADRLAVEAEKKRFEKEQVLKKLKEYAITRALRGDIPSNEEDNVLATKIRSMRSVVDNARRNPKTVEFMRSVLSEEMFKSFMTNNITDFDTYDTIQGLLTGHSSDLKNAAGQISEQIRAIKESDATDAANAAAAASKPSGK